VLERPLRAGSRWSWSDLALVGAVATGAVLRVWRLGADPLDFDETYTAMAARRPVGELLAFLRHHDAHPPLDYLLRAPLARNGAPEWAMRLPSAALSSVALVLFALWMRGKGRTGVLATWILAVGSFQLTYARDARMYAGVVLVGVVVAIFAVRWLAGGRRREAVAAGGALLVGLFLHASALLLAVGLLAVPGLRRDRAAWWWRASVVAALAAWGALWGPAFLDQVAAGTASWIPRTTPGYLTVVVNELVNLAPATRWVVLPALVLGAVLLRRTAPRLSIVWSACFLVSLALAAVIGARADFLLPRTLAVASWAPPVALATLPDAASRRWPPLGIATGALLAVLVVPSTVPALHDRPPPAAALTRVQHVATAGDGVGVRPPWLGPLVRWHLGVRRPGEERPLVVPGLDADVLALAGAPWTGRLWLIEPTNYHASPGPSRPCAAPWSEHGYRLRCLQFPG
jgi:uncharacterized membrane protein